MFILAHLVIIVWVKLKTIVGSFSDVHFLI